ncbi:FadR/GntR family transcriptional regulator [Alteribacillus sp. HJP-4]|uniref:FadR/GntR family transcriptional regulator n=1 Tax=Alteribacillus sp. HJP-4 TaxID=2775394 RepID=UPI0035CCD578
MKNDEYRPVATSLSRMTLAQRVEEQLVDLLLTAQLKPGDKLPTEKELVEMLQVSKPVMKEALSSLESLGILTRRAKDGIYFNEKVGTKPFSTMLSLMTGNLEAVVEARMTLELGLVTFAAEKITEDELRQLKRSIEAIEATDDNDYGDQDLKFHRIIALSVDNPIIQGMVDSLLVAHKKVNMQIQKREKSKTISHHNAIYDALEARDPQAAYQAMYQHLNFVRNKVLDKEN